MIERKEFSRAFIRLIAPQQLPVTLLWLAFAVALSACDTNINVRLAEEKNSTPEFKVIGNDAVSWLWIRGPIPPEPAREPPPIVWHIIPLHSNPLPTEIPTIVFGKVPAGWQQESPTTGQLPALKENLLYRVTVVTTRNRSANLLFRIENGRAVEYTGHLP